MADKRGEEGHDSSNEGGEGEGSEEVLPLETSRATAQQHLPQTRSISHSQGIGQADTPPPRLPFHTSSMIAYSPNAQHVNYHQNVPQRQQLTGRDYSSMMHQYTQPQLLALPPSQGAVSSQYFRQPFQHGQQMEGFLVDHTGATIAYGHPQSFGQPYPQFLPRLQPQQPIPGNQLGGLYYPMPQHHSRQINLNTPGTIARPEQHYVAPLQSSTFTRRPASAGLAGPGVLQNNSASLSRQSSGSSATSSALRGPPRKPKQSGYALWCGNLPAQTNIVELKDHFSRDATNDIESVFLISKSNCAFINYKTEQSCTEALGRFHDSRFRGAKLVCRLRRGSAATPAGTPTGPRSNLLPGVPSQSARANDDSPRTIGEEGEEEERDGKATQKAEEKFFILKSLTVKDLDASVQSGSWATQSHNEAALNAAYKSAKNVYLVFSANKSGEYYGYARMASGIDDTADVGQVSLPKPISSSSSTPAADSSVVIPTPAREHAPKGRIIDDSARGTIFWEAQSDENKKTEDPQVEASSSALAEGEMTQQSLGHPFKIEWLSTQRLHFHQARGLRNPWNQNREVKIARDGTEIEPSVGRRLVNLFHSTQAPSASSGGPQVPYPVGNLRMAPTGYLVDPRFARNY